MYPDELTFWIHQVWHQTKTRLEVYSDRVAENQDVMAAVEFARYVQNSGICKLCELQARSEHPKIDGAFLRWKASELERSCCERFRTNDKQPRLQALQLQSINEKLNSIAGYLAKLAVPASGQESSLSVIQGGLQDPCPAVETTDNRPAPRSGAA